jgi:hypothetical protein
MTIEKGQRKMKRTNRRTLFAGLLTGGLLVGLFVLVSLTSRASSSASLKVVAGGGYQNEEIEVRFTGFDADETLSLWQTYPDYKVLPHANVSVNDQGEAIVKVPMDSTMPVGRHALSAYGTSSERLAIGEFDLYASEPDLATGVEVYVSSDQGNAQGSVFSFMGAGYNPSEPISIWITHPDGSVEGLKSVVAGDDTTFTFEFIPNGTHGEGTYYLTAFGRASNKTGVVAFTIERGDFLAAEAGAVLEVSPNRVEQLGYITLTGSGFEAGEIIGLWLTLPNGSVVSLYEGVTLNGSFREEIYLPAVIPEGGLPAGSHQFSAYGQASQRRAVTSFELLPGNGLK